MTTEDPYIDVQVNNTGSWPVPEHLFVTGCREVLFTQGVQAGEISVTLLDDEGILRLNLEYFGKDQPTDVIAFALHASGEPVLGDVYIGFDQARRQASRLDIVLDEELLRLVIHGTLHVLGFQHPEGDDRLDGPMFLKQEEILRGVQEPGPG